MMLDDDEGEQEKLRLHSPVPSKQAVAVDLLAALWPDWIDW